MTKQISYSEYISEKLNKNISLDQYRYGFINFGDYISEELDKSISYTEYIAQELDFQFFRDNLDKIIESIENEK